MSLALYNLGGLRFWDEDEINLRELIQSRMTQIVNQTLKNLNPAWSIRRVEGPLLIRPDAVSKSYTEEDIFVTNHKTGFGNLVLRPETTESTYTWFRHRMPRLPICYWQVGKSFRRELNDGASANKLRYNEFYQQEFQCFYSDTTKADYRSALMNELRWEISRFTRKETRVVESDRLPSYSESTLDIEVLEEDGKWKEVASVSIRKDFADNIKVLEISLGLCRLTEISSRK